jgi:hypothetical protein
MNNYCNVCCFKQDTLILTENGYKKIQDLTNDDNIQTYANGFKKLDILGQRYIFNFPDGTRHCNQIFVYKRGVYPELFEDLHITGKHSILIDEITPEQEIEIPKVIWTIEMTDGKYLLPCCIDPNAEPYGIKSRIPIHHIVLENDDDKGNYGIYANGILTESCSKYNFIEYSQMIIINK